MVQYNSYSRSNGGEKQVINFDFAVRRFDFEVHGGNGGNGGGKGGFASGTYHFNENDPKYANAYPGEAGGSTGGDGVVAENYFANSGDGGDSNGGDGGSMSAIGVNSLLAVAGGGGGGASSSCGGGGGSPGGEGDLGGNRGKDGFDAETISVSFAQGLGGNGGNQQYQNSAPGSGAVNSGLVSNSSTGTSSSGGYVSVTTYGPPDEINSLTTSINSNYHPTLSWNAANNGITQRIYRKERTENSYSQVGTTSDSSGIFVDTTTLPNTTYSYKIVQDNNYFQDGNPSVIHTPDERVQVYRNGSWEPATLETY